MADEASANPGARLRGIREQRGLSLHQVAVELHVSDFIKIGRASCWGTV